MPSHDVLFVSEYKMDGGAGLCEIDEDAHENHASEDERLMKRTREPL